MKAAAFLYYCYLPGKEQCE